MNSIPIGSHLISRNLLYEHHGIYIGNGDVIHYAGWDENKFDKEPIVITQFEKFHCGDPCFHFIHPELTEYCECTPHPIYCPEEIVKRAVSKQGESSYDPLKNNCEHFVYWCIYGDCESRQTDRSEYIATMTFSALALAVPAFIFGTPASGLTAMAIGAYCIATRTIPTLKKSVLEPTHDLITEIHNSHALSVDQTCDCGRLVRIS